jgi:serine protease Do
LDICDNPHQASSDARTAGILVLRVQPNSPAYIAGVRDQDVIIRLDEQLVASASDFVCMIAMRSPGHIARLLVVRGNLQQLTPVTLGRWPDDLPVTPWHCAFGVA